MKFLIFEVLDEVSDFFFFFWGGGMGLQQFDTFMHPNYLRIRVLKYGYGHLLIDNCICICMMCFLWIVCWKIK